MEILFDECQKYEKKFKKLCFKQPGKNNFFRFCANDSRFFYIKLKCGIFKPTKKQDGLVISSTKDTQGFSQY